MKDEFIAAGIYRGEGSTCCILGRRRTKYGRHPELVAGVTMCDRDSVGNVARVFGTRVYGANSGTCSGGRDAWHTRTHGVSRVREFVTGWIARGLLSGEEAGQYFEAVAKCRRAAGVLMEEATGTGRPREIF